jgi:hypothetical protein
VEYAVEADAEPDGVSWGRREANAEPDGEVGSILAKRPEYYGGRM